MNTRVNRELSNRLAEDLIKNFKIEKGFRTFPDDETRFRAVTEKELAEFIKKVIDKS